MINSYLFSEEELKLFDYEKVIEEISKNPNVEHLIPRVSISLHLILLANMFTYMESIWKTE